MLCIFSYFTHLLLSWPIERCLSFALETSFALCTGAGEGAHCISEKVLQKEIRVDAAFLEQPMPSPQ